MFDFRAFNLISEISAITAFNESLHYHGAPTADEDIADYKPASIGKAVRLA